MRWTLLVCAVLLLGLHSPAQTFDASHLGDSIDLAGNWRFHTGDDVRWAQPDFDDSKWQVVSTKKSWSEQGVNHVQGLFLVPAAGKAAIEPRTSEPVLQLLRAYVSSLRKWPVHRTIWDVSAQ